MSQNTSKFPPESVDPSNLFRIISQLPRAFELVDFPRKDPVTGEFIGKLAIQVLTQEELMAASSQADAFAKKSLRDLPKKDEENRGYDDLYNNSASVEILVRACRDADNISKPVFPSAKMLRASLTNSEIGVLMGHYLRVQSMFGPIVPTLSDEECEAWLSRLEGGANSFFFDLLSRSAIEDLVSFLAKRLLSLRTGSSSAGSQPKELTKKSKTPKNEPAEAAPEEDDSLGDEFA